MRRHLARLAVIAQYASIISLPRNSERDRGGSASSIAVMTGSVGVVSGSPKSSRIVCGWPREEGNFGSGATPHPGLRRSRFRVRPRKFESSPASTWYAWRGIQRLPLPPGAQGIVDLGRRTHPLCALRRTDVTPQVLSPACVYLCDGLLGGIPVAGARGALSGGLPAPYRCTKPLPKPADMRAELRPPAVHVGGHHTATLRPDS